MKILEYGIEVDASNWSESNTARSEDGPTEMRSELVKRAIKSANQKLRQSTHEKNS